MALDLDINFMRSVLTLYDELIMNGISLVYIGKFNHQITKVFSGMHEDEMGNNAEDKIIIRRVYHAIVEILQNMQKHSGQFTQHFNFGAGIFMIGKKDSIYYMITCNKVTKQNMVELTLALDLVNTSTKEELKQMHKRQLKDGSISNRGGAGLGLIDIARKSEEKLDYLFLPIDDKTDYFVLKVEINSANFASENYSNGCNIE